MGEGAERVPDTLLDAVGRLAPDTGILPGRTSAELTAEAQQVADALKALGAEGEAVALRLPNGPGWVVHFLGLLAAGARPLPVAPDTPDLLYARQLVRPFDEDVLVV
ncbi:AMP-binding protein, partial [Streptomyces shenzhenensis]|uniref:AMP-binding protein n=1 Tax=Streptomyces shenzhenensis TaxID=943815 RepID=UPI0015F10021